MAVDFVGIGIEIEIEIALEIGGGGISDVGKLGARGMVKTDERYVYYECASLVLVDAVATI